MPILFEPRLIPGAQWEYSVEHVDSPEYPPGGTYSGKRLQFILATEGIYQHEQVLTETQVQEIKVRYAEVWGVDKDGDIPEETPTPFFIVGSGTSVDPYKMNYSSFLLTEE